MNVSLSSIEKVSQLLTERLIAIEIDSNFRGKSSLYLYEITKIDIWSSKRSVSL